MRFDGNSDSQLRLTMHEQIWIELEKDRLLQVQSVETGDTSGADPLLNMRQTWRDISKWQHRLRSSETLPPIVIYRGWPAAPKAVPFLKALDLAVKTLLLEDGTAVPADQVVDVLSGLKNGENSPIHKRVWDKFWRFYNDRSIASDSKHT